MSDMTANVQVDLVGNLQAQAKKNADAITQMGHRGSRALGLMNRGARKMGQGIERMGSRTLALATGGGLALAVKQVGNMEERLIRLGIQSGKTDKEMAALKDRIFETASAADVSVAPDELLNAVDAIVEKTGDLAFAEDNIRNIGLAIQATGAQGGAIGELLGEFQKMGIKAPAEVLKAMDVLNVQGKEGAFTLENLAALGPRVITAYTALGHTGVDSLREMGAALQMIRQGTGSSEMAATAFEATLRTLGNAEKIKQLESVGIAVKDSEGGFRSIDKIMADIIKKSGGDITKIGAIFDAEAVRAFNAAASEFKRTGSLDSLEKFMNVQADGTTTTKDAERAAKSFNSALTSLSTSASNFAESNLAKPIQEFSAFIKELDPNEVQAYFETAKKGLIGFGAAWATVKAMRGLSTVGRFGKGVLDAARGMGGNRGLGSAISGAKPIPVFVVNDMPGFGGMGGKGGKKLSTWRLLKNQNMGNIRALGGGAMATSAGLVLGAGALGYGAGTIINKTLLEGTETSNSIGKGLAHVMAFLGNDTAQAALKSERQQEAQLKIEVDDKRVRVRTIKTERMDAEVDTGVRRLW